MAEPALMNFYMFRAQDDEDYPLDSDNLGSLEAVMWYIHNEVVRISCPRHYNISRIVRYNVTMKNTPELFATRSSQFGQYVAVDGGSCTVPDCDKIWDQYGYIVGCQNEQQSYYGQKPYWYSVIAACPEETFANKTDECKKQHPGGLCPEGKVPDGSKTCTWTYEKAGEIRIDELEGISDYDAFCAAHHREYDQNTDKGDGCDFWDGKNDPARNAKRVGAAASLFAKHYPGVAGAVPSPVCDW